MTERKLRDALEQLPEIKKARAQRDADRQADRDLMARLTPPGFDAAFNADVVRQRGEFSRLCRDLAALPEPADFIARHDPKLGYGRLPEDSAVRARAAHAWLTEFLSLWDQR